MERQSLLDMKESSDDEEFSKIKLSRHTSWTKLERKLCLIIVMLLLLILALTTIFAVFAHAYLFDFYRADFSLVTRERMKSKRPAVDSLLDVCMTPSCVKAAAEILSNIDEDVDPCSDFYSFACGGWINRHFIPENKPAISAFWENQHNLNQKLRVIMEKELNGSEPAFVSMIKDWYDTCMDINGVEKSDSETLQSIMKDFGGWAVVDGDDWNEFEFDWIKTLILFRRKGYSHRIFLDLSVNTDFKNTSVRVITLDQGILGMPHHSFFIHGINDSITAAYFNFMVKSAKLLGADEANVENELMNVLNFEIALANLSSTCDESRNISKIYNRFTVDELQKLLPQIAWLEYFNGLMNDEITEYEPLVISCPEYIFKFGKLITMTEKRVIANYMLWRVVALTIPYLSKEWRNILHEYTMILTGIDQEEDRWEICISTLNGALNIALGFYYVRQSFDENNKKAGEELYKYIFEEFFRNLEKVDWMKNETKQKAKFKANDIRPFIGYPKELMNETLVLDFYKDLRITNKSYLENVLRLRKWSTDYEFSRLRKPYTRGEWVKYTRVTLINAFYKTIDNNIEILAGILQSSFFDRNRPHFMNFGAMGFILGHEITHGFDDLGRQINIEGNNVNWWDKITEENFKDKSQCIIKQYSNYTAENGMKINGIATEGENIADNGGLKLAYGAYRSWVKDNGPEQKLPGLKYNTNQLFWISTANLWCAKSQPEALKLKILTGDHSVDNFRVNGGLSNLEEFSEDFSCSLDSQMNKKHKCKVW